MCNAYFAKQCKGIRYYRMFLFDRWNNLRPAEGDEADAPSASHDPWWLTPGDASIPSGKATIQEILTTNRVLNQTVQGYR
nr:MAG TPA: hypothetical protein [Caudoviricetes sp.]